MAGLLTCSLFFAFPYSTVAIDLKRVTELTAAGTVQDFHPIPF